MHYYSNNVYTPDTLTGVDQNKVESYLIIEIIFN